MAAHSVSPHEWPQIPSLLTDGNKLVPEIWRNFPTSHYSHDDVTKRHASVVTKNNGTVETFFTVSSLSFPVVSSRSQSFTDTIAISVGSVYVVHRHNASLNTKIMTVLFCVPNKL